MEKKSLVVGIGIGIIAVCCLWLVRGGNGRYQMTSGPRGLCVVDTRTGEVWIKYDSPDKWGSIGSPAK